MIIRLSNFNKLIHRVSNTGPSLHRTGLRQMSQLLMTLLLIGTLSPALMADENNTDQEIVHSLSEIESGSLLYTPTSGNHYVRAPQLYTNVNINVEGMLARTRVEQEFTNDSNQWVEAVYVFPLPDNASVDALSMIVADKEVHGVIQTRKKAKRIYNTAKQSGKKASLLEQQRANIFTTKVANIPPGETALIKIAYQSSVQYKDGQFELMFPLTITPRYVPGTAKTYNSNTLADAVASGWALPTDRVPDADEITPPVSNTASPATISVSIDAGLDGLTIVSHTHNIIAHAVILLIVQTYTR